MTRFLVVLLITVFSLLASAAHSNVDNNEISARDMRKAVNNIVFALENVYLHPEKAEYLSQVLLSDSHTKKFKTNQDIETFRDYLRTTLVKVTHDTGFDISEEPELIRNYENGTELVKESKGSISVEISESNIGYLNITGDLTFSGAEQLMSESFQLMTGVDAMIIDLRLADKVDIALVQQMVSYFIPQGSVIGELKSNSETIALKALASAQTEKFKNNFPLYVVNSSFVAGEWEFFSHALQTFGKAVVVGENTMGVGELSKSVKVAQGVVLTLPYAVINHPETGESWEQSGITPEYHISSDKGMSKAYELALGRITQS